MHHKNAPSSIRDASRFTHSCFTLFKNKAYYIHKHAVGYHSEQDRQASWHGLIKERQDAFRWAIENGLTGKESLLRLQEDAEKALAIGTARAALPVRDLTSRRDAPQARQIVFAPFRPVAHDDSRTIVFVSTTLPPETKGGIGRFTRDTAEALAAKGHHIHVITKAVSEDTSDFEAGVWVHRIHPAAPTLLPHRPDPGIPQALWAWSATAYAETLRLAEQREIDLVEAPIWDCEGIAFLLHQKKWPLVTSLHTTLRFALEFYPERKNDEAWMHAVGRPTLALEKRLMLQSDGVRANSHAIQREIEAGYGFRFAPEKLRILYHGLKDDTPSPDQKTRQNETVTVLFVGRLELRKGIDTLLKAIPIVADAHADIRFRIIGADRPHAPGQATYSEAFLAGSDGKIHADKVSFEGEIADEQIADAYRRCDIFVAPSQFESLGLVFLEAMRAGKPVIGCDAGGMPEIIHPGTNGLLLPPGDPIALAAGILSLARDPEKRATLGRNGRALFLSRFAFDDHKVRENLALFDIARRHHRHPKPRIGFITSLCVRHDGISNAVRDEIAALLPLADLRLYAKRCDHDWIPFAAAAKPAVIGRHAHFQSSDLLVFHFGVHYPLFDLLKTPSAVKRVVVFHNITPTKLARLSDHRDVSNASFRQLQNIRGADHVICCSEENLRVLRDAGITVPCSVVPLAVAPPLAAPNRKPGFDDGIIRLVFIGRFVKSKGPEDLLHALLNLVGDRADRKLRIDLVGNSEFSDPGVLASTQSLAAQTKAVAGDRLEIDFHLSVSDSLKWRLLNEADIFVLPSYHEGFCLPVVEALSQGCQIVSYANSNIPAISGGLARLAETGNIRDLGARLAEAMNEIEAAEWRVPESGYARHKAAATRHASQYQPQVVEARFIAVLESVMGRKIAPSPHAPERQETNRADEPAIRP